MKFDIPILKPAEPVDLVTGIQQLLPKSGVVKVVNEVPNEKNDMHQHADEETLIILEGTLELFWKGEDGKFDSVVAQPGGRIFLPQNIPHYSVAGDSGCFYLITNRIQENLL